VRKSIVVVLWCFVAIAGITTVWAQGGKSVEQPIRFQSRTYHLGSFNQKSHPMWEFVSAPETVDNWTTLLTLIDRTDATTRPDLDRLAQGVTDEYKSHGGKMLMAKTMVDASGTPYNYAVVAFDEPAKHRFELNFVKFGMGPKNAYTLVYGVRITDPKDYVGKAKTYLNENSEAIGRELANMPLPLIDSLPRKEF
jgi:hypothetical protein